MRFCNCKRFVFRGMTGRAYVFDTGIMHTTIEGDHCRPLTPEKWLDLIIPERP